MRAARTAMGMDPGPELESISGQKSAGTVTEDRKVPFDGREIEASPVPTQRTPNYYPVAGWPGEPVPAGWYSEPWWETALVAGAWGVGLGALVRRAVLRDARRRLRRLRFRERLRLRLRSGLRSGLRPGARGRRAGRWLGWRQRRRLGR